MHKALTTINQSSLSQFSVIPASLGFSEARMSRNKLVSIVNIIMLCAMLFGMVAPVAQLGMTSALAQESTEEPAAETTAEAASEAETATPTAAQHPTSAPTEPVATESEPEASTPETTEAPVTETPDEPTGDAAEPV